MMAAEEERGGDGWQEGPGLENVDVGGEVLMAAL